jgi:hypothetical protein
MISLASVVFLLPQWGQNLPSDSRETKRPLEAWVRQITDSIYPIERVGVIARSVTFPQVLDQGQAIIDAEYPNASTLCMDVANYSGLVTGLIWAMDRGLVEEYGLQFLIDRATMANFPCALLFMPEPFEELIRPGLPGEHVTAGGFEVQVTRDGAPEEKVTTRLVNIGDLKRAIVPEIKKVQEMVRCAQTVKSNK